MSNGMRTMKINTQERAVSTDINRLQTFAQTDLMELARYLLNIQTSAIDPGAYSEPTTLDTPVKAEIVSGLMVKPQVGSFSLLVDSGLALMLAPDGEVEGSNYKYVRDAGVSAPGALVITANASGSIRIDVVECRVNPVASTVTDSRDIFDTTTGLFTAATVTKETKSVLEYRVRAGVGGAGYPGAANGWLPLCIASVPNGATSCNDVTFWDVRPLVADRIKPSNVLELATVDELEVRGVRTNATTYTVNGLWRATLNGRTLGGEFRSSAPGADAASINVANLVNQGASIAEPLSGWVYVYAATPFGLPRWARYNDAPSARVPRTPKGFMVVSYVEPTELGTNSTTIPLPASTGLAGTIAIGEAICVLMIPRNSSNEFVQLLGSGKQVEFSGGVNSLAVAVSGSINFEFSIATSFWPPNAKAMKYHFDTSVTIPANSGTQIDSQYESYAEATGTGPMATQIMRFNLDNASGGSIARTIDWAHWIPRPTKYPAAPTSPRFFRWWGVPVTRYGTAASYPGNGNLKSFGYRL